MGKPSVPFEREPTMVLSLLEVLLVGFKREPERITVAKSIFWETPNMGIFQHYIAKS